MLLVLSLTRRFVARECRDAVDMSRGCWRLSFVGDWARDEGSACLMSHPKAPESSKVLHSHSWDYKREP